MGKSCHLVAFVVTIVAMGEGNAQDLRGSNGIFAIGLIEVATPEQHHCIRMFRLQIEELLHHRGQFLALILCHYFLSFSLRCKVTSFFGTGKIFT